MTKPMTPEEVDAAFAELTRVGFLVPHKHQGVLTYGPPWVYGKPQPLVVQRPSNSTWTPPSPHSRRLHLWDTQGEDTRDKAPPLCGLPPRKTNFWVGADVPRMYCQGCLKAALELIPTWELRKALS